MCEYVIYPIIYCVLRVKQKQLSFIIIYYSFLKKKFFRWTKASLKWPLIIIIMFIITMLCRVDAISESWRSQKSPDFSFFRGLACYSDMIICVYNQSSSIYIMQSNYFSDPWSVTCSCAPPNPKLQRLFQLLAALEGM